MPRRLEELGRLAALPDERAAELAEGTACTLSSSGSGTRSTRRWRRRASAQPTRSYARSSSRRWVPARRPSGSLSSRRRRRRCGAPRFRARVQQGPAARAAAGAARRAGRARRAPRRARRAGRNLPLRARRAGSNSPLPAARRLAAAPRAGARPHRAAPESVGRAAAPRDARRLRRRPPELRAAVPRVGRRRARLRGGRQGAVEAPERRLSLGRRI